MARSIPFYILISSGSQSLILGPATSASSGNLLQIQIFNHTPGATEWGTLSHCVKPCLKLAITLDSSAT